MVSFLCDKLYTREFSYFLPFKLPLVCPILTPWNPNCPALVVMILYTTAHAPAFVNCAEDPVQRMTEWTTKLKTKGRQNGRRKGRRKGRRNGRRNGRQN